MQNFEQARDWAASAAGGALHSADRSFVAELPQRHRDTLLFVAACAGNLEAASELLDLGADVHTRNSDGMTPLFGAADGNHVELLRHLAERGAEINEVDLSGRRPLHLAARRPALAALECLLALGADSTLCTNDGWPPICSAARLGHTAAVLILLAHNSDHAGDALSVAVQFGHEGCVQELLALGAPLESRLRPGPRVTLVELAVHGDFPGLIGPLSAAGSPVNACETGFFPLHRAAVEGKRDCVRELLRVGAEVDARAADDVPYYGGHTPLMVAAAAGQAEVLFPLLAAGADPLLRAADGRTALDFAAAYRRGWAFQVLAFQPAEARRHPIRTLLRLLGRPR
jgi:ankyrin repeat protein